MLEPFKIEDLPRLDDGKVAAAANLAIRRAVQDCCDRPGDPSKRAITLKIVLSPASGDEGVCESIGTEFEISTKVPAKRSKCYDMTASPRGELMFNDLSPDNHKQRTLDEAGG